MPRPCVRNDERGAALVAAAVTLLLVSVLAATFMITSSGERSLSSNVHTARGSLYAADAGVRTARQILANTARAKLDSLVALYNGSGNIVVQPANLFPAGLTNGTSTSPKYATVSSITFVGDSIGKNTQAYDFRYTITATGNYGAVGARSIQSEGILRISAFRGNFTDYLVYTNHHLMGSGSKIWFTSSGYFDGPMHTNEKFRIAYRPTFEDLISSVDRNVAYYNLDDPIDLDANNNGTIDVPNLYGGFDRGVPRVDLPANSFSQQNAALGRDPSSTVSPTNSEIRTALGLSGSSAPPNGIYLPNSGGSLTGGIYIQGNLDECLATIDSLGRQVYKLKQGSTIKFVTVDKAAGVTYVREGSTTTTYSGAPRGVLYTDGSIADLGGPDRSNGTVLPGIANGTELLVAADGDITIQSDLTHQDYDHGGSVFGIFTANGDVIVGPYAPDDMHLDAYVMASATNGEFRVEGYNNGDPRGTFHLRGGMVTDYYGAFFTFDKNGTLQTGYARDFRYDRRGLIPPYFPTTSRFASNLPSGRTVAWKEL